MSDAAYKTRILTIARQCATEDESDETAATLRGWITADGTPTQAGRDLIDELDDQGGARSVFRNVP